MLIFSGLIVILEVAAASEVIHAKSFDMEWKNPKEYGASITCTGQEEQYVHIVTASGYRQRKTLWGKPYNNTYELTNSELFSFELACNCKEQCAIPRLQTWRSLKWTLVIKYKCQGQK